MRLGDLEIVEREDGTMPPLKLVKALTVIALEMHQEWRKPIYGMAHPDKSKESCILSSLTVRDFLRAVGFDRARVASVQVIIDATRDGKPLHSLGIGQREAVGPGWSGHMVVLCAGWIIDTTLYQAIRPAWPHLPGMLVVPLRTAPNITYQGLHPLSALERTDGGYSMMIAWLDDPTNTEWLRAPDADRKRRLAMVQHLKNFLQPGVRFS